MPIEKPLILFIDAYDSFSNNIISLLETTLNASIRTVKIDHPAFSSDVALHEELRHYAAVICGPGPGHPGKEEDVGIINRIWKLSEEEMLPVLGICLGFQSLCLEFGGEVKRLKGPQHGIIRKITHVGESQPKRKTIFREVGELQATLYQSLCADIGHNSISTLSFQASKWSSTLKCPDLVPLAWAEWNGNEDNDSGMKDEKILVAVQHKTKPFWALQYHPESICTNDESKKVIKTWLEEAQEWNRASRRQRIKHEGQIRGDSVVRESLLHHSNRISSGPASAAILITDALAQNFNGSTETVSQALQLKLPDFMTVPDITEMIQDVRCDQIILESTNAHETKADVRGRYSIIGLEIDNCTRFEYTAGSSYIRVIHPNQPVDVDDHIDLLPYGSVWHFLAQYLEKRRVLDESIDSNSPFWGGFMGYTTYELGLEGIDVKSKARRQDHSRPDLCFAWVTRSLVVDHDRGVIHLQEISAKKHENEILPEWIHIMARKLESFSLPKPFYLSKSGIYPTANEDKPASSSSSLTNPRKSTDSGSCLSLSSMSSLNSAETSHVHNAHVDSVLSITTPKESDYESKVRLCQEYISSGDSYELCLTDQTIVRRIRSDPSVPASKQSIQQLEKPYDPPESPEAWNLYLTLRSRQPAPFASFIRLGTATLISSSPERFLTWSSNGQCELRPMKGTVRKSAQVSTLAQATALLDVPKEKAENLMIVDLVRHDLHGVCGSGNVKVPRLMVVEEYKSVFQMISIVQGFIPQRHSQAESRYTGLDVLAASLPPGSMTGAPKKRSCEILQTIERKERSLYSGVVGYMDVRGRGDWSVTIRSMFRWDDEDVVGEDGVRTENWHIGAGGAVTTLSTPEAEREEMQTKLNGTLGLFRQ